MDGFININKPKDFTSHDVVNVIKRHFRGQKIGHGGTLDPAATGVLPICLGKGTKLQSYVMGLKKTYRGTIVFGADSPTLDMDGEYAIVDADFTLDEAQLNQVLEGFLGDIMQVPPMVSAIKMAGVPLYKLAKKGLDIAREPRAVTIDAIQLLDVDTTGELPKIEVEVTCSKGTYIRSLARDIGAAMGTKAIIGALTRTATGEFTLENSMTIEDVAKQAEKGDYSFVLPLDTVLTELPKVVLKDMKEIKSVLSGNPVKTDVQGDTVCLWDAKGFPYALGKNTEEGQVKPFKILYEPRKRKPTMELWQGLKEATLGQQDTAVALGNFDGVHLGHRYLIENLVRSAERQNLKSVIAAFSPHPRDYFCQGRHKYLQTKGDKVKEIDKTGADALLFIDFDAAMASMSPEAFVSEVLVNQLRAKLVYVGYNFKFGKGAKGDGSWLQEYTRDFGIEVKILDKITYGGEGISSSKIKEALRKGALPRVNGMLGYLYRCHGEVVYGNQIGRTIGFPTANIEVSESILLPANGIYTTWITYNGKRHPSVTNVGNRPTVGDNLRVTVETHILDDAPNLYGQAAEVTFINRIRPEEKFENLEALKAKIAEDAKIARNFFAR